MMRKYFTGILFFMFSMGLFAQEEQDRLEIKGHYTKETVAVVRLLDMYHYKKIQFDDSLSEVILDNYLRTIDYSRIYFYDSDVALIKKYYRTRLDDMTKSGDVGPAFSIYKVYEKRFNERMAYLDSTLINFPFDFTIDESYETDRSEAAWATTEVELNDIWRKIIKNQMLNLRLNGKKDDAIKQTILDRYDRMKRNVKQWRSEDVFQLYLNQVAEAYDPHSNYYSPVSAERFRQSMSLSLEGIGATLVTEEDYTKVVSIVPGGPAFKSNELHPDDKIVAVGQGQTDKEEMVDVIGWRIDDVVKLIKGPKGTWVRLSIIPAGSGVNDPQKILTLQREKVKLEDQKATSKIYDIRKNGKDHKMGVITIPGFYLDWEAMQAGETDYNSTTKDVKKLLMELKEQNVDGILVDLRNNGGGSLKEAIELTGLFIDEGPVVQVKDMVNKVEVNKDEDPGVVWDGPLTVMINRFSASASEIFAGAIQDYNRGLVVGEQSYGKGTVQTVIDLKRYMPREKNELGQLKLTFQKFYRVTGSSTQHLGVMPHIEFPSAFDADKYGESSEPSALPWDQIAGTNFTKTSNLNEELILSIEENYKKRLETDPLLQQLTADVNELRSTLENTTISLNEEIRKKERDEREAADTNSSLSGNINMEGNTPDDIIDIEDTMLREGVIMLAEIVVARMG